MRALVVAAVAACGGSACGRSSPSSSDPGPAPVSAAMADGGVTRDAAKAMPSAKLAPGDDTDAASGPRDDDEPACDPDDPRCSAPLESGRLHPRADAGVIDDAPKGAPKRRQERHR